MTTKKPGEVAIDQLEPPTNAGPSDAPLIYQRLVEVKRRVGAVRKDGKYDGGASGSYNFRGVDQVVNAVAAHFVELGILMLPTVLDAQHEVYESTNQAGKTTRAWRHLIRVEYAFVCADDASQTTIVTEGESIDYSDKGTAQAMSVALRIALLQALTLPTDELDPDAARPTIESQATVGVEREKPREVEPPADKEHREGLLEVIDKLSGGAKPIIAVFCKSQHVPNLRKTGATLTQINAVHDFIGALAAQYSDVASASAEQLPGTEQLDNAAAVAGVREQLAPHGDDQQEGATQ